MTSLVKQYPAMVLHYKGGLYYALGVFNNSATKKTQTPMVAYVCVLTQKKWTQPQKRFEGFTLFNKKRVPRFTWVNL